MRVRLTYSSARSALAWIVLCVLSLLALACDDEADSDESATAEGEASAEEEDAVEAEPPPPEMPPLHELTPADRMLVLASEPVPWSKLGELGVSFYDARLSFHAFEGGGLAMDLGHPAAAKYIQGRWKAPWLPAERVSVEEATSDDVPWLANRRVVWNEGAGASIRFPLPDDLDQQDQDWVLLVKMRPKVNRKLEVRLNDHGTIAVEELSGDWETVAVRIPAKQLRFGGENTISFVFTGSYYVEGLGQTRVAAKFDWIRLLPSSQVENFKERPPIEDIAVPTARILTTQWRSLGLAAPGRLDGYFVVPDHAKLRLFLAPAPLVQTPTQFRILARSATESEPRVLFDAPVEPGSPWRPLEFDLADLAGQAVRFTFAADEPAQGPTGEGAGIWLGEPALVIVRPDEVIGRAPRKDAEVPPPDRIVVVAIDALRPDRIAPEPGAVHAATPTLSRLANEGVRIEAIGNGAGAIVPTVSLLTGAYADTHGVADTSTHLRQSFVTLGDVFDEAGWETAMLSTNPYVSLDRGFAQGFDRYRNLVEEQGPARTSRLIDAAIRIVKKQTQRSRMIYVQVGGLRLPHMPDADSLAKFQQGGYTGPITVETMMNPAAIPMPLGEGDRRYLNAVYDAELFEIDQWVGQLYDALAETGDMKKTLIIITGTHGEPLGEDTELGYNNRPTNAEQRIPMIFWWPGHFGPGRRPEQLAEIVDLLPTIAELAGQPIPETAQGTSLRRVLYGSRDNSATPGFGMRLDTHRSVTWGHYQYILRTGDNDLTYDLSLSPTGPYEDQTDLQPIARRALRDALALHLAYVESLGAKHLYGSPVTPRSEFADAALQRGW